MVGASHTVDIALVLEPHALLLCREHMVAFLGMPQLLVHSQLHPGKVQIPLPTRKTVIFLLCEATPYLNGSLHCRNLLPVVIGVQPDEERDQKSFSQVGQCLVLHMVV